MSKLKRLVQDRHYSILLLLLLLFLLTYPYFEGRQSGKELILELIFFSTLAVVIDKLHETKLDLIFAVAFALFIWLIELSITLHFQPFGAYTDTVQTIFTLIFYTFATVCALVYVLRPRAVTGETFAAAAFAYLMVGITWGQAYQLVHLIIPGSFYVNSAIDKVLTWTDFLYFSIATMTSTGYGDLTPVTSQARSLASLEQVAGHFYMAVVMARLVGLYQFARTAVQGTAQAGTGSDAA